MGVQTFRRYTNLAALIDLLQERRITLLDPRSWDDKNDTYFLERYVETEGIEAVYAVCFAEREETYHHWRIYAHGTDGVCLEFDKLKILSAFESDGHVLQGYVSYKKIDEMRNLATVPIRDLPFLKRYPYSDENEFRVILRSRSRLSAMPSYPIRLSSITRVTLAPWMPRTLAKSVKKVLRSIDGCSNLRIYQSTLLENEQWKKVALQTL